VSNEVAVRVASLLVWCVQNTHVFYWEWQRRQDRAESTIMSNNGKSTLEYSFGTINVEIDVKGETEHPQQVIDYMLSAATAVLSLEALHLGVSSQKRHRGDEDAITEDCTASVTIGNLQVGVQMSFNLKQRISKRTINNVVFSDALPVIWRAAGLYFGDGDTWLATQSPLSNADRSRIIQRLEAALALDSREFSQQRSQEERQQLAYAGSRD